MTTASQGPGGFPAQLEVDATRREAVVAVLTGEEREQFLGWAAAAGLHGPLGKPGDIPGILEALQEDPGDLQPLMDLFFSQLEYGVIPLEVINTAACHAVIMIQLALGHDLTVANVTELLGRAGLLGGDQPPARVTIDSARSCAYLTGWTSCPVRYIPAAERQPPAKPGRSALVIGDPDSHPFVIEGTGAELREFATRLAGALPREYAPPADVLAVKVGARSDRTRHYTLTLDDTTAGSPARLTVTNNHSGHREAFSLTDPGARLEVTR